MAKLKNYLGEELSFSYQDIQRLSFEEISKKYFSLTEGQKYSLGKECRNFLLFKSYNKKSRATNSKVKEFREKNVFFMELSEFHVRVIKKRWDLFNKVKERIKSAKKFLSEITEEESQKEMIEKEMIEEDNIVEKSDEELYY